MEPRGSFHLNPIAGPLPEISPTQKYQQPTEWLPDISSNIPGGVNPQTINTILLDKGSNPTVVHFDDAVVMGVDAHQGNPCGAPSGIAAHYQSVAQHG